MEFSTEGISHQNKELGMQNYRKLDIDFELMEELSGAIDDFLHHINEEDGRFEDGYRCEIDLWSRDALGREKINRNQYDLLRDYYIYGGIYEDLGNPAYGQRKQGNLKTRNI